jgi:hypothetical protein
MYRKYQIKKIIQMANHLDHDFIWIQIIIFINIFIIIKFKSIVRKNLKVN